MTVQSQLAMGIATCGLTHFPEYATVSFILQTLSSVMIWVTTFLVCLEVMMHYTKCPDTKSNCIPIPPPSPNNVQCVCCHGDQFHGHWVKFPPTQCYHLSDLQSVFETPTKNPK